MVDRQPAPPPTMTRKQSPYERLKDAIVDGELEPGQPLIETALAKWLEVSRTPIREALTRLEQDGLVLRSDRGLVVRERGPEEILDIYETRIVLEATAGRVAAARRSALDVIRLHRLVELQELLDVFDEDAMVTANREFHRAIWTATHNESLSDLLNRLDLHLARYPAVKFSEPGRWAESSGEHRAIVDAIADQDLVRAHELATKHFTKARDMRLAAWARAQE